MPVIRHVIRRRAIARGPVFCVVLALLLTACAGSLKQHREHSATPQQGIERESVLRAAWKGQSYGVLVDTYGPPLYLMDIPGDVPNETVVVYGVRDNVSRCIDAFTVFHSGDRSKAQSDSTVTSYFCR
jgi:hypothetical protein